MPGREENRREAEEASARRVGGQQAVAHFGGTGGRGGSVESPWQRYARASAGDCRAGQYDCHRSS